MHNRQTHFKRSKLEDAFLKLNTSKYHSQGLLATLPLIFHLFSHKLFNNSAITLKLAQNDPKLLYFASKICTWKISTILIGTLWEWPHQVLPSLLPSNTASGRRILYLDSQKTSLTDRADLNPFMLAELQVCKPLWEINLCPKNIPWHSSLPQPLPHNPIRGCNLLWPRSRQVSPSHYIPLSCSPQPGQDWAHSFLPQTNKWIEAPEMTLLPALCLIKTNKQKKVNFARTEATPHRPGLASEN